jgi:AbrB family looped-hinge helix DNA binding protein
MNECVGTLREDGRMTIPAAIRRRLGLRTGDKLIFTIVGDEIHIRSPRAAVEAVVGSIEPLPGTTTEDFERQIDDASAAAAKRRYSRLFRSSC